MVLYQIGLPPATIANLLKNFLNTSISDMYDLFSNYLHESDETIATTLQQAGYDADQVKNFFTSLGDQIAGWFSSVF